MKKTTAQKIRYANVIHITVISSSELFRTRILFDYFDYRGRAWTSFALFDCFAFSLSLLKKKKYKILLKLRERRICRLRPSNVAKSRNALEGSCCLDRI